MGVETMAAMTIASGAMQYAQGKANADAIEAQAKFNRRQNDFNNAMLEVRKKDLMAQADETVDERYKQLSQILGSQRVAAAASGISLQSETALSLQEQEREFAELDIDAIRNNARKEAFGLSLKQEDMKMENKLSKIQAQQQAQQSIVTGGAQFASSLTTAYGYSKKYG